ncbi:hypothetical protein ABMA70_03220 [Halobacteriovorax sp. XZX-3]|uniref:hypothetical protein n=1 Tax=unclassified Halobacteriovorax TaxID=2639665 RepID=UPI000CCFD95E|nr:hypothetical protein [Halobacteriovorax sp. DA5]POB14743.1 hypothetical protein C0Z22_06505 [Halobacteriovorax sp. DA5]
MRSYLLLFYLGLGLPAFEVRFLARRKSIENVSTEYDLAERKQKLKKKTRLYKKGKRRNKQHYRQKHFALKGSHSKDARYSNGNKLRRMFINM